jgi:hypothetical protein
VGGPVKKDKLFFFFGYQGTITHVTPTVNDLIPTPAMIAGVSPPARRILPARPTPPIFRASIRRQVRPGVRETGEDAAADRRGCGLSPLGLATQVRGPVCRPRGLSAQRQEHALRPLPPHLLLPAAVFDPHA